MIKWNLRLSNVVFLSSNLTSKNEQIKKTIQ